MPTNAATVSVNRNAYSTRSIRNIAETLRRGGVRRFVAAWHAAGHPGAQGAAVRDSSFPSAWWIQCS
jgi:hypothetical protein